MNIWTPEELITEAEKQGWDRIEVKRTDVALFEERYAPGDVRVLEIPLVSYLRLYERRLYIAAKALGLATAKPSDGEM